MKIFCAISENTKNKLKNKIKERIESGSAVTTSEVVRTIWDDVMSPLIGKASIEQAYLLNITSMIPSLMREMKGEGYKFPESISNADISKVEVDISLDQNWMKNLRKLVEIGNLPMFSNSINKNVKDSYEVGNEIYTDPEDLDISKDDFIVTIDENGNVQNTETILNVVEEEGYGTVAHTSRTTGYQISDFTKRSLPYFIDVNGTVIPMSKKNIVPGLCEFEFVQNPNFDFEHTDEKQSEREFVVKVKQNGEYVGYVVYYKSDDKSATPFPTRSEMSLINIITNNGIITDKSKYNRVFGNIEIADGKIKFRVVNPLIIDNSVKAVDLKERINNMTEKELRSLSLNTSTRTMDKIFRRDYNRVQATSVNHEENNALLRHISSNGNQIGNTTIKLKGVYVEIEGNKRVVLQPCDSNGNLLKFSIENNEIKIDNENGKEVYYDLTFFDALKPGGKELRSSWLSKKNNFDVTNREDLLKRLAKDYNIQGAPENVLKEFATKLLIAYNIGTSVMQGNNVICDIDNVVINNLAQYNESDSLDYTNERIDIPNGRFLASVETPYGRKQYEIKHSVLDQNWRDFIHNLFFGSVVDENGNELSANTKLALINKFFYNGKIVLSNRDAIQASVENGQLVVYKLSSIETGSINKASASELSERLKDELSQSTNYGFSQIQLRPSVSSLDPSKSIRIPTPSTNNGVTVLKYSDETTYHKLFQSLGYHILCDKNIKEKTVASLQFRIDQFDGETKKEETSITEAKQTVNEDSKQNPTDTNVDDSDSVIFRSKIIASLNEVATEKQKQEAMEWFKSSPLYEEITFDEAQQTAHAIGVASWTSAGIRLTKAGDYADLYHESFHKFSQLYLTKEQKLDLYDSVRKQSGTFINHEGKTVSFKDASNLEIEEYLAESFRTYMLKNGKVKGLKQNVKKFFHKIRMILQYLFGKQRYEAEELFKALRYGNIPQFKENHINKIFSKLNRGIPLTNGSGNAMSENVSMQIGQLMDSFTVDFITMQQYYPNANYADIITYLNAAGKTDEVKRGELLSELYKKYNIERSTLPALRKAYLNDREKAISEYNEQYPDAKAMEFMEVIDIANYLTKATDEEKQRSILNRMNPTTGSSISEMLYNKNMMKKCYIHSFASLLALRNETQTSLSKMTPGTVEYIETEYNLQILNDTILNYGDIKRVGAEGNNGVIGYHFQNFNSNIEFEDEDGLKEGEDDDEENLMEYNRASNEQSALERIGSDVEVKFLLSSLPSYVLGSDLQYHAVKNQFGITERKPFELVKNKLNQLWTGCTTTAEMYDKLKKLAQSYPTYQSLLNMLGNPNMHTSEDEAEQMHWNGMTKDQKLHHILLWQKLKQVFACAEVPLYEVDMETNEVTKKDPETNKNVTEYSVSVKNEEAQGPYWKMIQYYSDSYESETNNTYKAVNGGFTIENIKDTTNGRELQLKAIVDAFKEKIFDSNNTPKENSHIYLFDLLRALGLNITPSMQMKNDLTATFKDKKFEVHIMNRLMYHLNKNDIITNPVQQIFRDYVSNLKGPSSYLNREFKEIISLDLVYNENVNTEMVKNAEGEIQFRNQLNNSISMLLNRLNKVNDIWEFAEDPALKHFIKIDEENSIDINGNTRKNFSLTPNVDGSLIIRRLFNLNYDKEGKPIPGEGDFEFGKRNKNYNAELVNFSGIKVNGDGEALFTSDNETKIIADMSLFLSGLVEFMRHADKKVSYGIRLNVGYGNYLVNEEQLLERMLSKDIHQEMIYNDGFVINMVNYLFADLNKLNVAKSKENQSEIDHKYINQLLYTSNKKEDKYKYNFGVFDDILSQESKDKLTEILNSGNPFTRNEIGAIVKNDIIDYLKSQCNVNSKLFNNVVKKYFVVKDEDGNVVANRFVDMYKEHLKKQITNDSLKEQIDNMSYVNLISMFSIMFTEHTLMYNIECIKLIYGDVVQYNHMKDEFTKRIGGMGSSGKVFDDSEQMDSLIDGMFFESSYMNKLMSRGDIDISENTYSSTNLGEKRGHLKTAIAGDVNSKTPIENALKEMFGEDSPYIKDYLGRVEEETNAQGYLSFDMYRYLSIREGKWSSAKEKLFQRICNNETITPEEYEKFFPILKLQFEGPLQDDELPTQAFHKYALMPLIPTMIKGKNLEKIHMQMMKEGIAYLTFNSASKISTKYTQKEKNPHFKGDGDRLYKDDMIDYDQRKGKSRELVDFDNMEQVFTPNYVPLAYFKDQVEIHEELDDSAIFSTQMRRLIEGNLFANGIPVDVNFEGLSKEQSVEKWKEYQSIYLDENKSQEERQNALEQMTKSSKYYELSKQYESYISKLTEFAINDIKEMFGMKDNMSEDEKAVVQSKVVGFLREEFRKKGLPEYVIGDDADIKSLQFSAYGTQIEKIIISLINRKVIRQHINGGQFVQVAGAFWEPASGTVDENAANDLPFYKVKKDGSVAPAGCKIPLAGDFIHLLQAKHIDGEKVETISRLNECLKDENWCNTHSEMITIIACRIPVQGHNSMEFLRISEFLEPGCNNIIVCPTELVIKSGGDYDVDKLSTILPNISLHNGKPTIVKVASPEVIERVKEKLEEFKENRNEFSNELTRNSKELADIIIKETEENGKNDSDEYKAALEFYTKFSDIEEKINQRELERSSDLYDLSNIEDSEITEEDINSKYDAIIRDLRREKINIAKLFIERVQSLNDEEFHKERLVLESLKKSYKGTISVGFVNNKKNSIVKNEDGTFTDIYKFDINDMQADEEENLLYHEYLKRGSEEESYDEWYNRYTQEQSQRMKDLFADIEKAQRNKKRNIRYQQNLKKFSLIAKVIKASADLEATENIISKCYITLQGQSRKAYENSLITTMQQILSLKANAKSLFTQNSTVLFTGNDRPAKVLEKNGAYSRFKKFNSTLSESEMSPTKVVEYEYNLVKHGDFNTGKEILGPAAIDNVFSSIARRVGLHMNVYNTSETRSIEELYEEKRKLVAERQKAQDNLDYMKMRRLDDSIELLNDKIRNVKNKKVQTLLLPHNTVKVKTKDGEFNVIDLSATKDALNENDIAEVISEYINGCVDVAKDPWIKYIQGNKEMIPIFMFMVQAGIPLDTVCYFVSNPLIVDYVEEKIKLKSKSLGLQKSYLNKIQIKANALGINLNDDNGSKKSNDKLKDEIIERINSILESRDSKDFFNSDDIKRIAINKDKKDYDDSLSLQMLAHFMEIEDMAASMNSLKLAVRVDATKNNSVIDVISKQTKYHDIETDERIPSKFIDLIKNESVLRPFFIEDFVKTIIGLTLPYKVDENILDVAMKEQEKSYLYSSIDSSSIAQIFQNEFLVFLTQRNHTNLSVNEYNKLKEDNKEFNDFVNNNKEFINGIVNYASSLGITISIDSMLMFRYQLFKSLNRYKHPNIENKPFNPDNKSYYDQFLRVVKFALFNAGNAQTMLMSNLNMAASLHGIKKFCNTVDPKIVRENPFLRYLTTSRRDNIRNVTFGRDVDSNELEMIRDNYNKLVSIDPETNHTGIHDIITKAIDEYRKQENPKYSFNDDDIKERILTYEDLLFNLPYFGILQSGLSVGKSSINGIFNMSKTIEDSYDKYNSFTANEQNRIMNDFKNQFRFRYSGANNIYQQDIYKNFDILLYSDINKATSRFIDSTYLQGKEFNGFENLVITSGGAHGADLMWSYIIENNAPGIKPENVIHYRAEYGTTEYQIKNSQKLSEFNVLGIQKVKPFGKSVKVSKEEIDRLRDTLNKYMGYEFKYDPEGKSTDALAIRNLKQVVNADEVFAVAKLDELSFDVKGGTKYAIKYARTFGKTIYVFNVDKANPDKYGKWFKFDYEQDKFIECETPSITKSNIALVGTRDIENYEKVDSKNPNYLGNKTEELAINAMRDVVNKTKQNYNSSQRNTTTNISSNGITQLDTNTISTKTDSYGVELVNGSTELFNASKNFLRDNPNGIIAYRKHGDKPQTFTKNTVEEGWIGNPFSVNGQQRNQKTVQQFYEWLVYGNNFGNNRATEEFRQAIINKIINTPIGSKILYFQQINAPSHATVIGYLIYNKSLLQQTNLSTNTKSFPSRRDMLNSMYKEGDAFIGEVSQSPYMKQGNQFVLKNNSEVEKLLSAFSKRGIPKERINELLNSSDMEFLSDDSIDHTSYYNIGYTNGSKSVIAVTNRELYDVNYKPKTIAYLRDSNLYGQDIDTTQITGFKNSTFLIDANDTKAIEAFDRLGIKYELYQVGNSNVQQVENNNASDETINVSDDDVNDAINNCK